MHIQPAEPDLDHASGGIESGTLVLVPISIHFVGAMENTNEKTTAFPCAVHLAQCCR
jgi:hypothetical protein